MYNGQAQQDKFVLHALQGKRDGYFLEIGSNHPIHSNNTYLLEDKYNWRGIMVEYDAQFLPLYKQHRPNSIHLINDASQIVYKDVFETNNAPLAMDYLQIDLEEENGSTLRTLQNLDRHIFDTYTFATVTFEHDIYCSNKHNTRQISREIFAKRGYTPVFQDINNGGIQYPYEDWYVHPTLVNTVYIQELMDKNLPKYINHPVIGRTINWRDIEYP
jgi:hypothetical protein